MTLISEIIMLTFLPFLELRASIPYGVVQGGHVFLVFVVAVLANFAIAVLLYYLLDSVVHIFLRIKWIEKLYLKVVIRSQKKVHKYVEKYGVFGLALFIGIPLPGSGVYSGALAAYALGFSARDYYRAALVGVLIAGVIVTLVSVSGMEVFKVFLK